jgi:hypothetical protein
MKLMNINPAADEEIQIHQGTEFPRFYTQIKDSDSVSPGGFPVHLPVHWEDSHICLLLFLFLFTHPIFVLFTYSFSLFHTIILSTWIKKNLFIVCDQIVSKKNFVFSKCSKKLLN